MAVLACLRVSYPLHNTHPIADPPKYGVLPIQMWRKIQSDEELHIATVVSEEMQSLCRMFTNTKFAS